jgi:hypothetical protein
MASAGIRFGIVLALLLGVDLFAQHHNPAFEVVSIRPAASLRRPRPAAAALQYHPGRVRAAGITAKGLISAAFPTDGTPRLASRIAGGPDWLDTLQFEFIATLRADVPEPAMTEHLPALLQGVLEDRFKLVPEPAMTEHLPALLQGVLEDRFKLRGHLELRPVPIYALVPARRNGTLGPLLRRSDPRSEPWSGSGQEYISAINMTMGTLASRLTGLNAAGRVVLDRTGLTGGFDVDLYWSPARTLVTGAAPPEVDGASLFTAVQEQLGLKLEARTERQDVYVVDHIEPPTPN